MKRLALAALTSGYLAPLVRPLVRGADTILTLHRFDDPERGVRGQDPAALRADLAYLRRHRYELVSVNEVVSRFIERPARASASIAFTVDDGYYDWYEVAAPIFAEFDCPVTVFLATGFVDGQLWNWWDKVEYILTATSHASLRIAGDTEEWSYDWRTPLEREGVVRQLVSRLERIRTDRKLELVDVLAASLEVQLPTQAPARYAAMSWDDVRKAAARGATFGPHTVTHPILAQCTDAESRWEIEESWRRVRHETDAAVSVFAYPNGQPHAISNREAVEVAEAGMMGAVTTRQQYVERGASHAEPLARYLVPRFPYPLDRAHLVQLTTGLERAKLALSRAMGGDNESSSRH